MSTPLTRSTALGYGIGSFATGMYSTVPGLLLLYYLTDILGVGAGLAGIALLLPRAWDVVSDPLIGSISDRTSSRWGRRRPYLLVSALSLPIFFGLLFSAPELGTSSTFVFTMVSYALVVTSLTVYQIPYIAMPAEMTTNSQDATRLMAYRVAFMTLGALFAGAAAPMLVKWGGGGRTGYSAMSWTIAGLGMLTMLASFWGTRDARFTMNDANNEHTVPKQVSLAFRYRPFRVLIVAYGLQVCGTGCLLAGVAYYATYVYGGGEETVTMLFLALMLPATFTLPLWLALSRRQSKVRCLRTALVIFAVAASGLWWSRDIPLAGVTAMVFLMGTCFAATQLFPYAMLPDVIALDRRVSGRNSEGIFTGIWTAIDKGGFALGGLATGLILETHGFVVGHAGSPTAQSNLAISGILLSVSLVPALLTLCAWLVYLRYDLDCEAT